MKKIIELLKKEHQLSLYYPEKMYFIALAHYLALILYDQYDYFVYLSSNFSLSDIDSQYAKILIFNENEQTKIFCSQHIHVMNLTLLNNSQSIDLTGFGDELQELKMNILKIQKKNRIYNPDYDEIFRNFGYLLENIEAYMKSGLQKTNRYSGYQKILSLLPRNGIDINFFDYLKKQMKTDFHCRDYYLYNNKICIRLFYIDDTIKNIEYFLTMLCLYNDISFNDLLNTILFLLEQTQLKQYLTFNDEIIEKVSYIITNMMNHKDYVTNHQLVKTILEQIADIATFKEMSLLYFATYESEIENYQCAMLKLQPLMKSKNNNIAYLAKMKMAYCKMMCREDLNYAKKLFKNLIKSGKKEDLGILYNNLGLVYYYQGNYKKAKKIYKNNKKNIKSDDFHNKETNKYYNNLALIEIELGNYDFGEEIFKKLIENNIEIYGDYPLQYVSDEFDNLGIIYLYKNDYKNAAMCFLNAMLRAETIYSQLLSQENYLFAKAKENRFSYGELEELIKCCNQDVNMENMDKAQTYYMIGELYFDRYDDDHALFFLQKALDLQKKYKLLLDVKLTTIIIDKIRSKENDPRLRYFLLMKYKGYDIYYSLKYTKNNYFASLCRETYQYIKFQNKIL